MRIVQYARRLECPSALSWPTWALAFLPSVTTAVLHDRNLFGGSMLMWLTAAIVGALAAGAVLIAGAAVLQGRRPLAVLLTLFLLAGVARGAGVGWSAECLGLVTDPQLFVRSVSGAVLAVFSLGIATLIVQGFRTHRAARMELESLERSAVQEYRTTSAELGSVKSRASADIVERTQIAVAALTNLPPDPEESRAALSSVARDLHETSGEVVRPLSHEVGVIPHGAPEPERPSRARAYLMILADTMTVDPFRPGWLMVILFPSILMTAIRSYGVGLGIFGAAWIVAMAALMLWWAKRLLTPRLRAWPVPIRSSVVIAVWLLAGAASAIPVVWATVVWGLGPERAWQVFGVPLLAYVPLTCLGIAVAAAISVSWALDEDSRQSRIAVLKWQTEVMQQGIWAERMRLGRYLHGSVQAALTSSALQIETSLAKGLDCADIVASVSTKLRDLVVDLERRGDSPPEPVDVTAVLSEIVTVWSRVATIDCAVDALAQQACSEDPDAAEKVVEITREAITNAIRHGRAGEVHVVVTCDRDGSIIIMARDNGSAGSGGAGFGSAMLDDLCLEWSRTREQGTVLTCRVATATPLHHPV